MRDLTIKSRGHTRYNKRFTYTVTIHDIDENTLYKKMTLQQTAHDGTRLTKKKMVIKLPIDEEKNIIISYLSNYRHIDKMITKPENTHFIFNYISNKLVAK